MRQRALERPALERVAVDEQRRVERVERRDPDVVEGTRADPAELGRPGLDAVDDPALVVARPTGGAVLELDAQRAARETSHRGREGRQLLGIAQPVGHREDGRRGLALAAGFVGPACAATGDGDDGGDEGNRRAQPALDCLLAHC
jgi:hypothetical protein